MSLLGRLLSGAAGPSTSAPKTSLDSNLEDQFTYNLLFPDAESLCHNDQVYSLSSGTVLTPAAINSFDVNGDLDLEMRDVRVIIMQEATPTSGSAYLLYDSHTPPPPPPPEKQVASNGGPPPPRSDGRRSISSPRKTSVGQNARPVIIQQEATAPRGFGAFERRPAHSKTLSYTETEGQRSAREYREEVSIFSNCIFGNSEVLAYKGTGTKVHILPSESKTTFTPGSFAGDGSLGRSSMRGSKLAQSFTSEHVIGPTSAGFASPTISSRGGDRKKVLITRMFPVPLPNDEPEDVVQDRTPTGQTLQANDAGGYPFPQVSSNGSSAPVELKKPQPKQKRTPMYAVGLVIHLPAASYASSIPISRSSFRAPGSYTEQESMPSSFNSARRAGWTMLGHHGFGVESWDSSFSSDVDDRIDAITQHWDIIMRTLSHLQAVTTASLLPMLKQADMSSPGPRSDSISHGRAPSASISISGKRVLEDAQPFKISKSNAKMVQLSANCLQSAQKISKEVDSSRKRIVGGIKAHQVVTGQGRWGIWREEARLVNKWAGGKDEGFFFFNLLTGFLGNHTEWLQALGPSWYRRRHYQQQRAHKDDDVSLPARTVIISDNKVMARRLIFLLAAFLPANQQLPSSRLHRPSTSTSFGGYSQSPPASYAVPILREESLRRRMNKRNSTANAKTAHSRTMSFPAQNSHPTPRIPLDIHHDRRPSDAASIKTANLPIPGSDIGTRKSSTATTSTATPVTTMPHFSTRRPVRGTGPAPRPGSSGSLATDDLLRSLKRTESSGQYSNISNESQGQNSRWGSMISGFWSSKRRDSSASINAEPPSLQGLEVQDGIYKCNMSAKGGKLEQMVDEASCCPLQKTDRQKEREARRSDGSGTTAKPEQDSIEGTAEQVIQTRERVPNPSGAYQSPVKTSINEEDGVIDIDVPLPDYLAFETAVSSPSSSGYLSTPGLGNGMEGFEHYSRAGVDVDATLNVGGWLQGFNPDFAVQAIPSQVNIIEEIKEAMRAEPTPVMTPIPHPDGRRTDRWVDVSSAVVADTTNFSIKHILYRRLIRLKDEHHSTQSIPNSLDSRYGNVYSAAQLTPNVDAYEGHIEEKFIEEPIISLDETLVEAIERIIAQSGQASNKSSVSSSRSTSRKRGTGRRERSNSDAGRPSSVGRDKESDKPIGPQENKLEVPRNECKKMVLQALEEIVREVVEGRRDGGNGGSGLSVDGARERGLERAESFLREGVRNWLVNVEGGMD